jgi:hypothetical protein
MKKIHVISTCALTKQPSIPAPCHLSSYTSADWHYALREWLVAIQDECHPRYQPVAMYRGSHWKESLHCIEQARSGGFEPFFWILSAGWGLIADHGYITPYAATFAGTGTDSIHKLNWPLELTARERSRMWWDGINEGLSDVPFTGRLLNSADTKNILLILSKEYFQAIEHELLELLGQGWNILVVSASMARELSSVHPSLRPSILPLTEKFKQLDTYLDHTNVSLNARLATWLFKEYGQELLIDPEGLKNELSKLEASLPERERKEVVSLTDEEVLNFIDKHFEPQSSSASKLLRFLRSQGLSCEQKRFRDLFIRYKEENPMTGGLFDVGKDLNSSCPAG